MSAFEFTFPFSFFSFFFVYDQLKFIFEPIHEFSLHPWTRVLYCDIFPVLILAFFGSFLSSSLPVTSAVGEIAFLSFFFSFRFLSSAKRLLVTGRTRVFL